MDNKQNCYGIYIEKIEYGTTLRTFYKLSGIERILKYFL